MPKPILLNPLLGFQQLKDLLDSGESVNVENEGYNALHATFRWFYDREKKTKLLIEAGVNINSQENSGYRNTPLHLLVANEHHNFAVFFIELASDKLDYSLRDFQGKTTLITACKINSTQIALALLKEIDKRPEILDQQDHDGMTALHYACMYGNQAVATALLRLGASSILLNSKGKTAIDCLASEEKQIRASLKAICIDPDRDVQAPFNHFVDRIHFVLSKFTDNDGDKQTTVPILATQENIPRLLRLLQNPYIVDQELCFLNKRETYMSDSEKKLLAERTSKALKGISLVHSMLISAKQLKLFLIEAGHFSSWLLRAEAAEGNENVLKLLIRNNNKNKDKAESKTKINEAGASTQRTALHQAASRGHRDICLLLLDNGAQINCEDSEKETPLHLAVRNRQFEMAKQLMIWGAQITTNKKGINVLHMVTQFGMNDLKQELIRLQKNFEEKSSEEEALTMRETVALGQGS